MRAPSKVRGSVLIIVLVTLLFTGFALVVFVEKASVDLLVELRESSARRLRQQAYSALEVTLAVLEDFRQVDGGLRSPAEGWNDPLAFAGWSPSEGCTAEVTFDDESGKISLAHVEAASLIELFKSWEFSQSDSERLTDALLTWMRKDYVPTTSFSPDYDRVTLPYVVPQRALRSFSELAAIEYAREVFYDKEGRPNDLWRRFADTFSLFDFKQSNLNAARPDVLTALGAYDQFQQKQLGEYLSGTGSYAQRGPGFFQTTADAAGLLGTKAMPAGFGTDIRALRINITIHQGRAQFRLTAVIAPPSGATTVQPMVLPVDPATTTGASQSATATATNPTGAAPGATTTTGDKKLNYPFTLLEIRENVEIPPTPAPPPQA
jgi:general secretion pathway protein K